MDAQSFEKRHRLYILPPSMAWYCGTTMVKEQRRKDTTVSLFTLAIHSVPCLVEAMKGRMSSQSTIVTFALAITRIVPSIRTL